MPHSPLHREELQTEEQFERAQKAARELGFGSVLGAQKSLGLGTITSEDLKPASPISFITTTPAAIPAFPEAPELTASEQEAQSISERLQKLNVSLVGEEAFRGEQQRDTGLTALQRQQRDLTAQLDNLRLQAQNVENQRVAELERLQISATGRGITRGGLQPQNVAANRAAMIKQADITSRALTVAAQLNAVGGNIETANQQIADAVNAKYAPIKEEINVLKSNLDLIIQSPEFTAEIKAKAEAQKIIQNERERTIEEIRAEEDEIYKIALTGLKYGASTELARKAFDASSKQEASILMSEYLQNPQAKLELETARLDNILKQEQIKKTQKATELLGEPTAADKKKIEAELKNAEASIPVMRDKIEAVNTLIEHPGMGARVGTGILSRGQKGFIEKGKAAIPGMIAGGTAGAPLGPLGIAGGAIVGGITTAFISGRPITEMTGAGQSFAGGVHKLTSGLTLQSLIDAKAQGATFGALSDTELAILAAAATQLSDWEIKDKNGQGTGYWNIDEASFKRELKTIQDLTRRALAEKQGSLYTPEEQALFDALEQTSTNPSDFY